VALCADAGPVDIVAKHTSAQHSPAKRSRIESMKTSDGVDKRMAARLYA
jgi:hypothetical protein